MGTRSALLVVSDTHCGGSTGLFPPDGVVVDDGQQVLPSEWQRWLWERWAETWQRAEEITRGYRRVLICNGDLVDGFHHQTFQIISANPDIQKRIAFDCLKPAMALNPERLLVVRGTPVHVGEQANLEEGIARELGAHRNEKEGTYSWWNYYGDVAGVTVKVFHHGKLGRTARTEQAAIQRMACDTREAYDRAGAKPPDLVFVGHLHRWGDSGEFACRTRALMSPGWQGPTQHVHRIAGHDAGLVPVGIWVVLVENGKRPVCIPIRHEVKPQKPDILLGGLDEPVVMAHV